jgi:hypothetical protein
VAVLAVAAVLEVMLVMAGVVTMLVDLQVLEAELAQEQVKVFNMILLQWLLDMVAVA